VVLTINQVAFEISEADLLLMILGLAAGELDEDQVAAWFRERIA
jgi:death on curing protein